MRADARFGAATTVIDPMTPVLAEVLGLGPGGAAELGTDPAAIDRAALADRDRALRSTSRRCRTRSSTSPPPRTSSRATAP